MLEYHDRPPYKPTRMHYSGHLHKMHSQLADPVQYSLQFGDQTIDLTNAVGTQIHLCHSGAIHCIHCGRKTSKSFNQGYCYPCFRRLAQCDLCIVKPEQCHFDQGTCREPEWGQANCFQPHYVYLANASGIKVGITRASQIPTRWIDQGASAALPIIRVQNRKHSGLIEVAFKQHVADKTQWQKMLKGPAEPVDLPAARDQLIERLMPELETLATDHKLPAIDYLDDQSATEIHYPVTEYPQTVRSLNLDKTPDIQGKLMGIKGQYLILDRGVINLRKFAGYEVSLDIG